MRTRDPSTASSSSVTCSCSSLVPAFACLRPCSRFRETTMDLATLPRSSKDSTERCQRTRSKVNLPGFHAGCGVPRVSRGRLVWSQAVVAWRISYSTGVSMPREECRRCRLWKVSRYSKMALDSSRRVFHRHRAGPTDHRKGTPRPIETRVRLDPAAQPSHHDRNSPDQAHRHAEPGVQGAFRERPDSELTGFNRSKRHQPVGVVLGARRGLRLVCASRNPCVTGS